MKNLQLVHKKSIAKRPSLIFLIFLLLLSFNPDSRAQKKKKTSVGPGGGTLEISPLEFQATMNDFFYKFARTLMESADKIRDASSDPKIDQEALIWKINAIPVANASIYNGDPFLGFVDMAVFIHQMKLYFESGAGKSSFGDQQNIALEALDMLWKDLQVIGNSIDPDGDISEGTKIITDFAEENPITSSYFVRQSTIPLMLKIQTAEKVSFKSLALDMSQSLEELRAQVSSYMEILPKLVRWESEYLINSSLDIPELTSRFDSLTSLLERSVLFLESSPELIDIQRKAAFQDITEERMAVIQALRQEREIILEEIKKEREIVLSELSEQLNLQREASFRDLTILTDNSLEMSFGRMESLIDKLYWRTVILIGILMVLIFVGFVVYKRI